jgi:hypothetical protein
MAQSRAAGDRFAGSWMHHGWVVVDGEKMSKSAGNAVGAAEALTRVRPIELRAYLLAAHYRSTIDYSDAALSEAAAGFRRIEALLDRVRSLGGPLAVGELPPAFVAALDDDLATPAAMRVLHTAPAQHALVLDDATTEAGAQGQREHVPVPLAGTEPCLGPGGGVRVVLHDDGQSRALLQLVPEGLVAPAIPSASASWPVSSSRTASTIVSRTRAASWAGVTLWVLATIRPSPTTRSSPTSARTTS